MLKGKMNVIKIKIESIKETNMKNNVIIVGVNTYIHT